MTQPTLSNGIAPLENELGERLLLRATRKVALIPVGEHVMPCINGVLSAQASLVQQTQAFLTPAKRLFRIGTSPLVSAKLLALMLEPFRSDNAEVDVVLREMNMTDLYRMLEGGLLDVVVGVAKDHKGPWVTTPLYEEPLRFIPRGAERSTPPRAQGVQLKDIADVTCVMVPDACGLSRATRALFRSQRRQLKTYSGEVMRYQVREDWSALGIGAAILPQSKLSGRGGASFPILDKAGRETTISFEAAWSRTAAQPRHLQAFAAHLRQVAPAIVGGLGPTGRH